MTNKNLNLSTLAVCLACSTTLLLGACGGGGSGKTRTPTVPTAEETTVETETPDNNEDNDADAIPVGEIDANQFVSALGGSNVWKISSTLTSSNIVTDGESEALPVTVTAANTLQIISNNGSSVNYRSCGEAEPRAWSATTSAPLPLQLVDANGLVNSIECASPAATYSKTDTGALAVNVACGDGAQITSIFTSRESLVYNQGSLDLSAAGDASLAVTGDVCADLTQFRPDLSQNSALSAMLGQFPSLSFNQDQLVVSGEANSSAGSDRIGLSFNFSGGIQMRTFTVVAASAPLASVLDGALDAETDQPLAFLEPLFGLLTAGNAYVVASSPLFGAAADLSIDSGTITVTEANPDTGRYIGSYELVSGDELLSGGFDVSL